MKKILKLLLKPIFGRKIFQPFFRVMYLVGLKGMNFGGGANFKDSGEDQVIKYALKNLKKNQPVVFDVGGNKGEYTKLWLKYCEQLGQAAKIYLFEPSSSLVEFLRQEFAGDKQVELQQLALSDQSGEGVLYSDSEGSTLASLAQRDLSHFGVALNKKENVRTETLDYFCLQKNIQSIDFLKLDVEGWELSVLKGAENLLKNRKIKFIQFEFGGTDIDARVFFRDFYRLLHADFKLYRILKDGLEPVEKYSEIDEIFITTNYLAELKYG